ncbi:hypothetical protein [Bradyrhizobium diversitatis]|uniref:hypothetical protein n=1 Tax=Bradyrhizobium diversitatis TaxID=2755406 RepID=UPI001FE53C2A|nr:hypothetical protein [Bradyrhizobium diversitatis]
MVAMAEEAQRRFRAKIETGLGSVPAADLLAGFHAFRLACLRWATAQPRACPDHLQRARFRPWRWRVEEREIERVAEAVLDLFIAGVAKP